MARLNAFYAVPDPQCPSCGYGLPPGADRCPNCAVVLRAPEPVAAAPPPMAPAHGPPAARFLRCSGCGHWEEGGMTACPMCGFKPAPSPAGPVETEVEGPIGVPSVLSWLLAGIFLVAGVTQISTGRTEAGGIRRPPLRGTYYVWSALHSCVTNTCANLTEALGIGAAVYLWIQALGYFKLGQILRRPANRKTRAWAAFIFVYGICCLVMGAILWERELFELDAGGNVFHLGLFPGNVRAPVAWLSYPLGLEFAAAGVFFAHVLVCGHIAWSKRKVG